MKKAQVAHVVKSELENMGLYSDEAQHLLMMIIAHESCGGYYLKQVQGPALGITQMEPATHEDVCQFLKKERAEVYQYIVDTHGKPSPEKLMTNLAYSIALSRAFFLRFEEKLPEPKDAAEYAKWRWNTPKGKATPSDYSDAYNKWS